MPEIELDKEGNTIYIDDDGQRQTLIERIGPGMTEKHNRLRELVEQQRELDEKLIANSKEQGQIIRSLVTRVEQDPQQGPQKDPMDMTLDELYQAYLESIRKAGPKLNRKETEETENRDEQISKKIDTAKNMLKVLNLCESLQHAQPGQSMGQVLPRTLHTQKGKCRKSPHHPDWQHHPRCGR